MRYIEWERINFNWGLIVALIINFSILALFIIGACSLSKWLFGD